MPEEQLFCEIEQEAGKEIWPQIDEKVDAFKAGLSTEQRSAFVEIEDLYSSLLGNVIRVAVEKR